MSSVPFSNRHLGVTGDELDAMARAIGVGSLEGLVDLVVPEGIRRRARLELPEGIWREMHRLIWPIKGYWWRSNLD